MDSLKGSITGDSAINSQYQGSQAFNNFLLIDESVNSNTGSLTLNKSLIKLSGINKNIDLDFSLIYSYGAIGTLGLPSNWGFSISYVLVSNNIGISLTAQGKNSIIDYNWSDEQGYKSGLRYENSHGVKFEQIIPAQPLPSGKSDQFGQYAYRFTYDDGSIDYFDAVGKLIEHSDRFGNYINYHYRDSTIGVFSNSLDYITDSYGQNIIFEYSGNDIIITLPSSGQKIITCSPIGVVCIEDEIGSKTTLEYLQNSSLVNNIKYATGLETVINYTPGGIGYKNSSGNGSFPAVQDLIHLEAGKVLEHTQYIFGYATRNTFTGANDGCILSKNQDSLMESSNTSYIYDVLIKKLDQDGKLIAASDTYYNYLHLSIKSDQFLVNNAGTALNGYEIRNTYYINPNKHARTTNYNKPTVTEKLAWSNTANKYISLNKIVIGSCDSVGNLDPVYCGSDGYDYFGNLLKQTNFIYDQEKNTFVPQQSSINTYIITNWGGEMSQSSVTNDLVTGQVQQVNYLLTVDEKNISSESLQYKNYAIQSLQSWKTTSYIYDQHGRIKLATLQWSAGSNYDSNSIKSTTTRYDYAYNNHLLIVTTTDALNNKIIETYNESLPNDPLIKVENALGEIIQYDYDVIGRKIGETDAMGNKTSISYYFYAHDNFNGKITTNPVGYMIAKYYDALGKLIELKDNGNPTKINDQQLNRTLFCKVYNCLRKVKQKTNHLGLITSYEYDSFGRKISITDPLNNTSTIDYNDAELTTNYYINGNLHKIEKKDGNDHVITINTYPDSDDESVNYYLNHIIKYNGVDQTLIEKFNQVDMQSNAVICLRIISFTYDPDKKIIKKNLTGYTDNKVNSQKTTVYDLLGKPLHYKKVVKYNDGRTYSVNSENNLYNEMGDLISVTNALGQSREFAYDAAGRCINAAIKDASGAVINAYTYTYYPNGYLSSKVYNGGKIDYTYYPDNSKKSITDNSTSVNYTNYLDGVLKQVTYSDGKTKIYTLDKYGRTVKITDEANEITTFEYSDQGLLSSKYHSGDRLVYSYGTVNHTNGILTEVNLSGNALIGKNYEYNGFGVVMDENVTNADQKTLLNTSYIYDALNRLTTMQKSSAVSSDKNVNFQRKYQYDGINQLSGENTTYSDGSINNTIYTYDGNGNVLTKIENDFTQNYQYNEIDQMISPTVRYDQRGRIVGDDLGFVYSYNDLDQLTQIKDTNGNVVCNYGYYPDGLLLTRDDSKTTQKYYYYKNRKVNSISTNDNTNNVESWKTFLFDGKERIGEYVHGEEVSPSYSMISNGSTAATLNNGILEGMDYKPYGEFVGNSLAQDNTDNTSFLWDHEYYEINPGLVYLRARFYNPRLMRFMTTDTYPVDNKYSFGNADPINMIDPSGHVSATAIFADAFSMVVNIGFIIAALLTAPLTEGSSLLVLGVVLGVIGGGLGFGGSTLGLINDATGGENKKLQKASLALNVAGAAASLGGGMIAGKESIKRFTCWSRKKIFGEHPLVFRVAPEEGLSSKDLEVVGERTAQDVTVNNTSTSTSEEAIPHEEHQQGDSTEWVLEDVESAITSNTAKATTSTSTSSSVYTNTTISRRINHMKETLATQERNLSEMQQLLKRLQDPSLFYE